MRATGDDRPREQSSWWVNRPLDPGEKSCPVRSASYGEPKPHLRLYGRYGRCHTCKPVRTRRYLRDRLYDWWNRRRWQREQKLRTL